MAIGTPSIESPADDAAPLNFKDAIFLRKSIFVDTAPPATTVERQACTEELDGNWTNPTRFSTGTSFMDDMASVAAVGAGNRLGFTGLNFAATSTLLLSELTLTLDYLATWSTPPGYAGDVWLKGLLSYLGRTIQVCRFPTPTTEWTNTHTDTSAYRTRVPILDTIRDLLGRYDVTIGDVETLAADLNVFISSQDGDLGGTSATGFKAGPLALEATYYNSNPLTQVGVQWQFASDAGFVTVVYDSLLVETVEDIFWLPAISLPSGSTLYARVRQKASNGSYSSYSATRICVTLSSQAVGILELGANSILIADFEFRMFIDGSRFKAGGANSHDWWVDLERGVDIPLVPFRILDVIEDGVPGNYSSVAGAFSGSASTFAYPFSGADRFWLNTSDNRPPAGFSDDGIQIVIAFGLATKGVLAGPGDNYEYRGLIVNNPEVEDQIDDLISGHGATVATGLELDNRDGFFNTLLSTARAEEGLLIKNCKVQLSLVGSSAGGSVNWVNRQVLWEGICSFPTGEIADTSSVKLDLSPRRSILADAILGTKRYSVDEYPNLHSNAVGAVIPELIGNLANSWLPTKVVNTTGRQLRPVVKATTIAQLAATNDDGLTATNFGTPTTGPGGGAPWWSFSTTTNLISITAAGYASFDTAIDYAWYCRITAGDVLNSAESGDIAMYLLEKSGAAQATIASGTFAAFADEAYIYADAQMQGTDALKRIEIVSGFNIIERASDGKFEAVVDVPENPDSNTAIILFRDLKEPPKFSVSYEHMVARGSLKFHDQNYVNVASSANGGVATASSTYSGTYPTSKANDGDRKGGGSNYWADGTASAFPDWLQIDFSASKAIEEIDVFSLSDSWPRAGDDPTLSDTFTRFGLVDFDVQYWNGSTWVTVPGGTITGNNKVWRRITFASISTSKIRILVNATADGVFSRIVEVEAYAPGAPGLAGNLYASTTKVSSRDYHRSRTLYGITTEDERETASVAPAAGWEAVRSRIYADADIPRLLVDLKLGPRFALCQAGRTVMVALDEGLRPPTPTWWPSGMERIWDWELCKVLMRRRNVNGVDLQLRWLRSMSKRIRP